MQQLSRLAWRLGRSIEDPVVELGNLYLCAANWTAGAVQGGTKGYPAHAIGNFATDIL